MENRKRNDIHELIYGNTAVQPARNPVSPKVNPKTEEDRKFERLQRENKNKQTQYKNHQKIKILSSIGVVAVVAFSFIFRTGELFRYQKQYNDLVSEERQMVLDIEGYRAKIIKSTNIETIMVKASELGMDTPSKDNTYYVDLSINHFSEEPNF